MQTLFKLLLNIIPEAFPCKISQNIVCRDHTLDRMTLKKQPRISHTSAPSIVLHVNYNRVTTIGYLIGVGTHIIAVLSHP